MNTEQNVRFFLDLIFQLEERFLLIGQDVFADLENFLEDAVVAYNAYDFSNTKIPYQRRVFKRNRYRFCFEYSSIDATYNETKITISSNYGLAEGVMLTDDLIYKDGLWYVWSPINVEENDLSNLIPLNDEMIAQIFHEILEN